MIKVINKNINKLIWCIFIWLCLYGNDVWGQSGKVKFEIRVDSIVAFKHGEPNLGGKNEYRYKFKINNTAELNFEINDVSKNDLPKLKKLNDNNSVVRWENYGNSFVVSMEAWEEDCDEDNNYNSCDDVYCTDEYTVNYKDTEPGIWHKIRVNGSTPFWCPDKYSAFIYYKWSPPTPPDPVVTQGKVCKNEDVLQFTAPDHYQKQYVTEWQWQRGEIVQSLVHPTPSGCYDECGGDNDCMSSCMAETPVYEDEFSPNKYSYGGSDKFSYANNGEGFIARYRQKYSEGVYSPWSDTITETNDLYEITIPTNLDANTDGTLKDANTNLYCGSTSINLTVKHSDNDDSWENHYFTWYRSVGEGKYVKFKEGSSNNISDDDFVAYPGQQLQYKVEVNRVGCSTKDSINSNPLFFFEDVPNILSIIDEENDIKKASCPDSHDAELTIKASSNNPDLRYYYNIGLLDTNGKLETTEIYSSERSPASDDYTFENLISGDYIVQILHGGYEGGKTKEYTLNAEGDLPSAGYCFKQDTIHIGYRAQFTIDPATSTKVSCHGGNDGSFTVPFSNKEGDLIIDLKQNNNPVSSNDYNTTTNNSSVTISGLREGKYFYEINDSRGCRLESTDTDSVTITEPDDFEFNTTISDYNGSDISCRDYANASITVTASGGNQTNKYSAILKMKGTSYYEKIDSFTTTTSFTGLEPGNYNITVTPYGCSSLSKNKDLRTIIQPEYLVIDSITTRHLTCYGEPNGEIFVSASGGTGTRRFRIDGGAWESKVAKDESYSFSALDSGWHVIEVKDTNNCVTPEPFRFRLDYPTPLNFEVDSLVMPQCYGGSDGKLFIRPFGGDPITQAYKVSIRHVDSLTSVMSKSYSVGDPPLKFKDLPSAHYEVTIHDTDTLHFTCSKIVDTVFLDQPTPVTLETVQVNIPSCTGANDGSVHIKAKGGTPGSKPNYYYSMDGINYKAPNEDGIAIYTGLAAGDQIFYAVDGHHEDYYESPILLDNDSHNQLCTGTLSFTLDEPELITVYTSMHPVSCYGTATGSIVVDSVSGGRGGYTYEWEFQDYRQNSFHTIVPANPQIITNAIHGSYRLTVRDIVGCTGRVEETITQPAAPLAIQTIQPYPESCVGTRDGILQLSAVGGYPPYTYQIDGGAEQYNNFFDGLSARAYTLTVRDQLGCELSQTIDLPTDELLVEVANQLPATVGSEDGLLRLSVSGGKNKKYYLDGKLSITGSEFNGLAAGEHTVSIEFNNQCQWGQSYIIDEVAAPVPGLRVNTEVLQNIKCYGDQNGSVRVAITGGVAPYQLLWNDPLRQTAMEAVSLAIGNYVLTVTDAVGATLDYPVVIEGPEHFKVANTIAVSPNCYQGADGYAEVNVVGGTPPYAYYWNDSRQQTTAQADQLTAGTYIVTVTDQNGCTLSEELTVDITPPLPDVLEPEAITLCTGQSVSLDAGSSWQTHQWTSDNGFRSEAQEVRIDQAGRYFLKVISNRGCFAYDTLDLITTDNVIEAEFLLPTEIIEGDTVALTEVSWPVPEHTVWTYGEGVISQKSEGGKEYVIFPSPGEYTITLSVMIGNCADEVQKKIIVSNATSEVPVENARLGYVPKNEYLLYPNPNHGLFTLEVAVQEIQDIRVSVYDPLFTYRYYHQTFTETKEIEQAVELTQLKHGVYTLMIETSGEIKVIRFIIQ